MNSWAIDLACITASAALTALALSFLLSRYRSHLPLDVANERSLHVGTVPRIGGMAMMLGLGAVLGGRFLAVDIPLGMPGLALLLAAGLALMSFLDDRRHLPVLVRLAGHLTAAIILASFLDLPLFLLVPMAVATAWMTNLYNFMDGADGLAGTMALIGFAAYGAAAWTAMPALALVSLMVAAAAAGFLAFNFPPARVFMGDAGSVPLGFLAASLGMIGWQAGIWPAWFPVVVFSPFIADASVTLAMRALARKKVWQAHRDHHYQRLIRTGWSHRRLLVAAAGLMILAAGSAVAALAATIGVILMAIWVLVYPIMFIWIQARWRSFAAGKRPPGA